MVKRKTQQDTTKEKTIIQKSLKKKKETKETNVPETAVVVVDTPSTSASTTSIKSLSSLVQEPSWSKNLQNLFNSENFKRIEQFLNSQWSAGKVTFPPKDLIFEAFNKTPFDQVKVVLLGQDPYHDNGQVKGIIDQSENLSWSI